MAGKPIGKVAMTATQRQQRWRNKKRRRAIFGDNPDPTARRPTPKREDLDFWPTPAELRTALIDEILPMLPPGPIWECAAGDGLLVDALQSAGRDVIASDIDPQRADILRYDFLHDDFLPATLLGDGNLILITNPPFGKSGLLDPFLEETMNLLDAGYLSAAVLLLRSDATSADCRIEAINRATFEFTCCWRQRWIPDTRGQPRWCFHWIVWLRGNPGPPVNRRLPRPMPQNRPREAAERV